jgi:hypothetical protein
MRRLDVSDEEATTLREILDSTRKELLHEDAKSDTREFREMVLRRLAIVERLLAKVTPEPTQAPLPPR